MDDLPYLLALHKVSGLGSARLSTLFHKFKNWKSIWLANSKDLGLSDQITQDLIKIKSSLIPEKYFEEILKAGIKVTTITDLDYPASLKEIYDPPLLLYYLGTLVSDSPNKIAVVGSRKVSGYGKFTTQKFTKELADYEAEIISGLAQGVDTIAHQTALDSNLKTVAVLGGGLNQIFPAQNKELAKKISAKGGAIISEYPPDYLHLAGNFPARNRIVAGLSQAVVVTEAAAASGSLITARLALEQGKDVFAVPGQINSYLSEGTNNLIKSGAFCLTSVEDITQVLSWKKVSHQTVTPTQNLNLLELRILTLLSAGSMHIDQIIQTIKEEPGKISAALIKMEIAGHITNLGTGVYIKNV
jgi:DNA processing protein